MNEKQPIIHILGDRWVPVRSSVFPVGLPMTLVLVLFLSVLSFSPLPVSHGEEFSSRMAPEEESFNQPNLSSLNVRLSATPIIPPSRMVTRTVLLEPLRGNRPLTEESIRSAIIEDDAGRQVLIISAQRTVDPNKSIHVYLLHDVDLESRIPTLKQCMEDRQCAQDRQPGTGGLACLAICLVKALHGPTS